jgi:hypothetical protein
VVSQLPHLPFASLGKHRQHLDHMCQERIRQCGGNSAVRRCSLLTQVVHVAQKFGLVAARVLLEHRMVGDVLVAVPGVQRLRQHAAECIK